MMLKKICTKCGVEKKLDSFHKAKSGKLGRTARCKECRLQPSAEWRKRNAEKRREYQREYYKRNREAALEYSRRIRTPKYNREKNIYSKYGITQDEFLSLLKSQENKCACCGKEFVDTPSKRGAYIDHCHNSKRVRGLLCNRCNAGIGFLGDTIEGIQRAIDYLQRAKQISPRSRPDNTHPCGG